MDVAVLLLCPRPGCGVMGVRPLPLRVGERLPCPSGSAGDMKPVPAMGISPEVGV